MQRLAALLFTRLISEPWSDSERSKVQVATGQEDSQRFDLTDAKLAFAV